MCQVARIYGIPLWRVHCSTHQWQCGDCWWLECVLKFGKSIHVLLFAAIVYACKSVHMTLKTLTMTSAEVTVACMMHLCFKKMVSERQVLLMALTNIKCVIVLGGGANVPNICGMFSPCETAIGFNMELYDTARRSKQNSVIVKKNIVVGIDILGQRWIGGGGSELVWSAVCVHHIRW